MHDADEQRFAEFVRTNSAALFRTGYLMTGDYQRAEDLLQGALVRVYQHWERVEAMEHPLGYARKILINQAASLWRRRWTREVPTLLLDEPTWGGGVEEVTERSRVWEAVLKLPTRQRAVLVLRYYEDLTEAEIAETLRMAPGTVKSHAHAALRRLELLLSDTTPTRSADEEVTS